MVKPRKLTRFDDSRKAGGQTPRHPLVTHFSDLPRGVSPVPSLAIRRMCVIPTPNPTNAPRTTHKGEVPSFESRKAPRSVGSTNSNPMEVARVAHSIPTASFERGSSDRVTHDSQPANHCRENGVSSPSAGLSDKTWHDRQDEPFGDSYTGRDAPVNNPEVASRNFSQSRAPGRGPPRIGGDPARVFLRGGTSHPCRYKPSRVSGRGRPKWILC